MSRSPDDDELHQRMDSFFQAQDDLEEDNRIAQKCGISPRDAALIRAWWVIHDEREEFREEAALKHQEMIETIRAENENIEGPRKRFENWSVISKKRAAQRVFMGLLEVAVSAILYRFLSFEWAAIWAFFCLLMMAILIEEHLWTQNTKPEQSV
jgi:hypothetical protein